MRDWNKTYEQQGEIQTEVTEYVSKAVLLLKERNVINILDLGCGTGRHSLFLAEQGFNVYAIDVASKGLEITQKKAEEKNLKIHIQSGNMHNIPFEDDFFDAVLAIYVIEHNTMTGLEKTIKEIRRVLRAGGILITNLLSIKDLRCGMGKEVEHNTFDQIPDPHEDAVIHHFSDEKEARELFKDFGILELKEVKGFSKRRKKIAYHWHILAEK